MSLIKNLTACTIGLTLGAHLLSVPHGTGYNFNRDDLFSILRLVQRDTAIYQLKFWTGKLPVEVPKKGTLGIQYRPLQDVPLWLVDYFEQGQQRSYNLKRNYFPSRNYLQGIKLEGFHRKKKTYYQNFI